MRIHRALIYVLVGISCIPPLFAQGTPTSTPAEARCYSLSHGEWSPPLGVNAAYHEIPAMVRLDAVPMGRVVPDIAYPTTSRHPELTHWSTRGDSIEIKWSDGFQATMVHLAASGGDELHGIATIWEDAMRRRWDVPHVYVVARRTPCAGRP